MTSLLASEGGWQEFTLKGGEWLILAMSGLAAVLALIVGWFLAVRVLGRRGHRQDEGDFTVYSSWCLGVSLRQFRTIGILIRYRRCFTSGAITR